MGMRDDFGSLLFLCKKVAIWSDGVKFQVYAVSERQKTSDAFSNKKSEN